MSLSIPAIEAAAPDQASLKAASKLLAPAKWPEQLISGDGALIWGACQGSGANPYRVVVDTSDLGAKCSCPSRKFPCKHALALMLLYNDDPADFAPSDVPQWVTDWLGRRRKTNVATETNGVGKSVAMARAEEREKSADAKANARKVTAASKRAAATRVAITDGLVELEAWIADQLRTGLSELLGDLSIRCRRIAARLVDAKASSLAGRVDGIPARVLAAPPADRPDVLIGELGKLVLIARAWGDGAGEDPAVRRLITGAESRDILLADPQSPRHTGIWEVLSGRDEATRDGLIARSTWLLGFDPVAPRFALLQDFLPVSIGKQESAFVAGEQFHAELVFYSGPNPLRAQIVSREPVKAHMSWPQWNRAKDVLEPFSIALSSEPWLIGYPLLLSRGQLGRSGELIWWSHDDAGLPIGGEGLEDTLLGAELRQAVVLWNGYVADLLVADTNMGRFYTGD